MSESNTVPDNDSLIANPAQTMKLIAEGLGHYARLACAGFVHQAPETLERMAELLRRPDEGVIITATLRAGVLHTSVGLMLEGQDRPSLINERADTLPPITLPSKH